MNDSDENALPDSALPDSALPESALPESALPENVRVRRIKLDALRYDEENVNLHTEHGMNALTSSVQQSGFGRPILATRDETVIAGNATLETLHDTQFASEAIVVETDGRIPIIHVRRDIERGSAQARKLALADNRVSALNFQEDEARLHAQLHTLVEESERDTRTALLGTGYSPDFLRTLDAQIALSDALDDAQSDDDQRTALFTSEEIIDDAFAHYRATGFPFRRLPLHECKQQINALALHPLDDALAHSALCSQVADTYHEHRYETHARGMHSPVETFHDDDRFRRALALRYQYSGNIPPHSYFGELGLARGTQACANFRPAFASLIYRTYAPQRNAHVLDPSAGFGGRLTGFIASLVWMNDGSYTGIDPSTRTDRANRALARDLLPRAHARFLCKPAEDATEDDIPSAAFDFALTSPPYFNKEEYADEPTQSYQRYTSPDAWRTGFLFPMIALTYRALKNDALFALCIEDIRLADGHILPLVALAKEDALRAGFRIHTILHFPLPQRFGQETSTKKYETVLILHKP